MAGYYVASGMWPVVHMRSFETVTGPKTDHWLVKTVAALAIANGVALAFGLRRDAIAVETVALAVCSATAFAAVDAVFVLRGRIRPIYLADAAFELALAAAIVAAD
jgi:presenilin-like A22 family membrane protease